MYVNQVVEVSVCIVYVCNLVRYTQCRPAEVLLSSKKKEKMPMAMLSVKYSFRPVCKKSKMVVSGCQPSPISREKNKDRKNTQLCRPLSVYVVFST